MKVQCVLAREGGTKAEIGGIEYHFEPLADGAHVAEVENEAHIDRFLGIPEAYKVYHGKDEPKGVPLAVSPVKATVVSQPAAPTGTVSLAGSEQHPPQFEIDGTVYSQRDVVEKAFAASGMTPDEWNDLGDDERAAKIDITLDELADSQDEPQEPTRDELVAAYEAKFGKKPHHKAGIDKIKAELEA